MLYTAFIFGLISSLHCIGMCGPIAMMLPVDRTNQAKKTLQIFTYHLGRLSAYGTIGFLFGLLGKGFSIAGIQQELSIFLGVAMIIIVLVPERFFMNYNFSRPIFTVISKIKTSLGSQFKNKSYQSLFTIGVLNGFLPCGMVYAALAGAISTTNSIEGGLFMAFFGLGTLPLLLTATVAGRSFSFSIRSKMKVVQPILLTLAGLLLLQRGLHLDLSLFESAVPKAGYECH